MHVVGIISMTLFAFCYIPQIISIIRTKNVSGISLWLWIIIVIAYIAALLYAIWLKALILIIGYIVGLTLSFVILVLVVYHGKYGKTRS